MLERIIIIIVIFMGLSKKSTPRLIGAIALLLMCILDLSVAISHRDLFKMVIQSVLVVSGLIWAMKEINIMEKIDKWIKK